MPDEPPYFHVALNLPHAGRVALRLVRLLLPFAPGEPAEHARARRTAMELAALLAPCYESDENPAPEAAQALRAQAAELGRTLVDQIERGRLGGDRIGQAVRNLFECLEHGREGAAISLRAGENPRSLQRPC